MQISTLARFALAIGAFGAVTACIGTSNGPVPATPDASTRLADRPNHSAMVYFASQGNARIVAFPIDASGATAPSVAIKGGKTHLTQPAPLAVSSNGTIYTANNPATKILVFAPGATGNVSPQTLGGKKVPLQAVGGIAVDASDNIYVSDYSAHQILVFTAGSTGNTAPIRTISGTKTDLSQTGGMAIDGMGDLFVINGDYPSTNSILEFAPGANGNVKPIADVGGSNTTLIDPRSVSLDGTGRIFVDSNETSVVIFAKGSNGNVAPAAVISGSKTNMGDVTSVAVSPSGEIFVTDDFTPGTVLVFAAKAKGNVAPTRTIAGSKTRLADPIFPSFH